MEMRAKRLRVRSKFSASCSGFREAVAARASSYPSVVSPLLHLRHQPCFPSCRPCAGSFCRPSSVTSGVLARRPCPPNAPFHECVRSWSFSLSATPTSPHVRASPPIPLETRHPKAESAVFLNYDPTTTPPKLIFGPSSRINIPLGPSSSAVQAPPDPSSLRFLPTTPPSSCQSSESKIGLAVSIPPDMHGCQLVGVELRCRGEDFFCCLRDMLGLGDGPYNLTPILKFAKSGSGSPGAL